jgi:hypothetical protein
MIVGMRGVRPLTRPAPLLGANADTPFPLQRDRIHDDEVLVVTSGNLAQLCNPDGNALREENLATAIQGLTSASANEIVECLRTTALNYGAIEQRVNCTFVVARRK